MDDEHCACKDDLHKGQACWRTDGLPHPSRRCTWCRNGH